MNTVSPVDQIRTLVTKTVAYFDVVRFFVSRALTPEEYMDLLHTCSRVSDKPAISADGVPILCLVDGERVVMRDVKLDQPRHEALEVMCTLQRTGVYVAAWYVEVSLDWCTETEEEARQLFEIVEPMLFRRGRGDSVKVHHKSRYSVVLGYRCRGQHLAVYADRRSKMCDRPCVHIEWRARSMRALRSYGIHDVEDLASFWHSRFWQQHMPLRQIDLEALGKRLGQRHLSRKRQIKKAGALTFSADRARARAFLRTVAVSNKTKVERLTALEVVTAVREAGLDPKRIAHRVLVPGGLLPFLFGTRRCSWSPVDGTATPDKQHP